MKLFDKVRLDTLNHELAQLVSKLSASVDLLPDAERPGGVSPPTPAAQQLRGDLPEPVHPEGLGEEGVAQIVLQWRAADEQHGTAGIRRLEEAGQVAPVYAGHEDVGDQQVDGFGTPAQQGSRVGAVGGLQDGQAGPLQGEPDQAADRGVVISDQDGVASPRGVLAAHWLSSLSDVEKVEALSNQSIRHAGMA